MKLAVSNLAWPVAHDAVVAEVLRAECVGGVELAPSKVWARAPRVAPGVAESYAAWWRERGCAVVAFQGILFGHPEMSIFSDGDALAATQRHMVEMGELASRCGARVLVFGAPVNRKRGQRSMSWALAAAAAALRPVAVDLAPLGVHLCVEPNAPRYECDFVTTAAEAAVLAEAVSHPNFGVHLDAAALSLSGELSEAALAPVMKYVRHFHVSEVDLVPVGTTTAAPHTKLGNAVRALGYAGWFSIEMRVREDDAWLDAIPRAIAVARQHYG